MRLEATHQTILLNSLYFVKRIIFKCSHKMSAKRVHSLMRGHRLRCLRTRLEEEYLELIRMKKQDADENCIMGSHIIFSPRRIFLE
jgi:hypothetical protein